MDSNFRPLILHRTPNPFKISDSESEFWSSFKKPFFVKEFLPITCLHYSPIAPHQLAVTNTNVIQIYDSKDCSLLKSITSIKDTPFGANFREDGKLLIAGDSAGVVHIFELERKSALRKLTGHTQPVQRALFSSDGLSVISCSDDKTVRIWDLASGDQKICLEGHSDYVRSGLVTSTDHNLCVTGSYDHTVRLWDARDTDCCVKLEHGAPVESLLMFPSGSLLLSAGGKTVKVWDIRSNSVIKEFSNHHKTVTQLYLSSDGRRLFTGSLDGLIKVYDVTTYNVIHAISYPAPILCVAFSPAQTQLAVGMSSGLLSVKTKEEPPLPAPRPRPPYRGAYRYFMRGKSIKPTIETVTVSNKAKKNRPKYDIYLKKFKYTQALDAAFDAHGPLRPTIVMSMFKELSRRDGLSIALANRNEDQLLPIIQFIGRNIINPKYCAYLVEICDLLTELYPEMLFKSAMIKTEMDKIKNKISSEVRFHKQVFQTLGVLENILGNSN
ncbi:U3 small nucleolar RNA-associated protein 15 [Oopsacas minuta]|uniref:U3 small nucleolar RNA-associated protein 15 homolog n=1 Tax=Oopsacas minuta TaxID=111878 RepID=A0AAV7KBB1_9METZ|nr:U3 small nucleolar RNA-associated protein 15 [Oopsacas minuta]